MPNFDASIKTKYEYAFDTQMSRFSVRNSRMGLSGHITNPVTYRVQVELSSEGHFEVLDMSANILLTKDLSITLGQTSVPVFNSYITTPSTMLFANRAFIGKYFAGSRDIGIMANYKFSNLKFPLMVEMGVFNGNTINNPLWTDRPSIATRISLGDMEGLRATGKIYRYPKTAVEDYVIWGADIRYAQERYKIEAEVMNRHNKFNDVDRFSLYIQGGYSFPLKGDPLIKDITPVIRWDAIGENLRNNKFDANRLTFGLSFGLTDKPFGSLIRLDYESYIVKTPITEFNRYEEMDSNKITLELLIIF
ncbi:MAG: porin [Bacteroidales bacterium]|nr:porin [Bacteroidales bacterium]